ncbi:2Fe-2S iron-sulfur cluster-binding protein [Bartonella sp. DGB1]|uniref:2Fe-2S iron-sulfur cluster-binding protein n=1 Tax=Bartonella sp. DGB1 TaxID=3239807 RepID=UPI003524A04C
MIRIAFINANTQEKTIINSPKGLSLMEIAVANDIKGIDAICGGAAACATCHVHIKEKWQHLLPKPEPEEELMLAFVDANIPYSRLACQIIVNENLNGIEVIIP